MNLSAQMPDPSKAAEAYNAPHYAHPVFVNPAEEEFGREWAFFSPDGSAYKGTWKNALRHGFGVHVYANGDLYKGEFKKNLPDGAGQYYSRIQKLHKNDQKHIEQQPELLLDVYELVYDGQWEKGRRKGFGRFHYGQESFYCGWWEQNLRHGRGALFYAPDMDRTSLLLPEAVESKPKVLLNPVDKRPLITHRETDFGSLFIGEFQEDARNGPGIVIYGNGDVFYGSFRDNAAFGPGVTYYVARHSKAESFYENGESVQSQVCMEYSQLDYEQILRAWAHVCGGFPGISLPVFDALQEKFPPDWEEAFRPYEDAYPYVFRPGNSTQEEMDQQEQIADQIRQLNAPEEICALLPIKMRKTQVESQKLLHLPQEDHGKTIPVSVLLDPQQVLADGLKSTRK